MLRTLAATRAYAWIAAATFALVTGIVVATGIAAPTVHARAELRFTPLEGGEAPPPAAAQLESDDVVGRLAERVGWTESLAELRRRLTVVQTGDEVAAELVAEAESEGQALQLVDAWIESFVEYRRAVLVEAGEGGVDVEVVALPSATDSRVRDLVLAVALGLVAAVGVAVALARIRPAALGRSR